jgi:hypothetical protein
MGHVKAQHTGKQRNAGHQQAYADAGAHKEMVRGVRWLGTSSRIVSFSSEKAAGGWRNSLLLTDVRNRLSIAFREVGAEAAPMLGIRASPSGRYVLVLLLGAPSEIWAVRGPLCYSMRRMVPACDSPDESLAPPGCQPDWQPDCCCCILSAG